MLRTAQPPPTPPPPESILKVPRDAVRGRCELALIISMLSGFADCFIIPPKSISEGRLMDVA